MADEKVTPDTSDVQEPNTALVEGDVPAGDVSEETDTSDSGELDKSQSQVAELEGKLEEAERNANLLRGLLSDKAQAATKQAEPAQTSTNYPFTDAEVVGHAEKGVAEFMRFSHDQTVKLIDERLQGVQQTQQATYLEKVQGAFVQMQPDYNDISPRTFVGALQDVAEARPDFEHIPDTQKAQLVADRLKAQGFGKSPEPAQPKRKPAPDMPAQPTKDASGGRKPRELSLDEVDEDAHKSWLSGDCWKQGG